MCKWQIYANMLETVQNSTHLRSIITSDEKSRTNLISRIAQVKQVF